MPSLEEVYAANREIGRLTLARLAGTTQYQAQKFLDTVKHGVPPAPAEPPSTPSPLEARLKASGITEKELDTILKSVKSTPSRLTPQNFSWNNSSFKFAAIADTHFGHLESKEEWWLRACDLIEKTQCQVVLHAGDITEGMSGRPGHYYELNAIGVTAQVNLAAERLSILPCPVQAITGNHDAWAFKAVGVDVGEQLAMRLPGKYTNLGPDEATVTIDGVDIGIWHGGDGSSYATSYRTQKFVEGLTGGEKPHILLSGHAHKSIFHVCRNIFVLECGTLCGQTSWMRGKKLAAHTGFWINEVWPAADGGIERFVPQWIPFFK